uniref:Uncharacterized protein n=1 Tax=uncultured marine virus TaxID=186617 RepID=A0A0F7L859_9VIRU|nr:hypothetical protein [uncultured marine virus]
MICFLLPGLKGMTSSFTSSGSALLTKFCTMPLSLRIAFNFTLVGALITSTPSLCSIVNEYPFGVFIFLMVGSNIACSLSCSFALNRTSFCSSTSAAGISNPNPACSCNLMM